MNASTLAPVAEIRRLRAQLETARQKLAELRALVAQMLGADSGPVVQLATAVQWAAEARAGGFEAGHSAGYLAAVAEIKGVQAGLARVFRDSAPDLNPWHLCCRPCRLGGHRPGCRQCEERTRATFGRPHPDDYSGKRREA